MEDNKKDEDQFQLRFSKGGRSHYAAIAEKNGRSLTQEILTTMRQAEYIPVDVAAACMRFGDVKSALDFALRIFDEAGVKLDITLRSKD
ncbi:MAG: Arc-like binding domain [Burkholderiaceae bacterium]|nr:Arc-like binding domain [Burkholderiaceae bacterium]